MKKVIFLAASIALPASATAAEYWGPILDGNPVFYNSAGSKQAKASSGRLHSIQAQGGTSPTVQIFDDEDGTCDENPRTGTITLVPDADPLVFDYNLVNGICVLVGGTGPEVTVAVR